MENQIAKLAFNIVTNFLNIKKDDAISIYAEIFDNSIQNTLSEIPIMEELAIAIRKRKAFPLLEITTQNLQKRFFEELSDDILGLVPQYFLNRIDKLSAFLEIGWKALGNPFETINIQSKIFYRTVYQILEKIYEKKKKIIYLNYPSEHLANYVNTDYELILKNYFSAVNCDYQKLYHTAEELEFFFKNSEKIEIKTKAGLLKFLINTNEVKVFPKTENQAIILPTGKAEIPIKRIFLNGEFFAEKIYYKNHIYKNVFISFKEGHAHRIEMENSTGKESFEFKNNLIGSKEEIIFSFGFNPNIKSYTNFYSYDRNIYNAVSIKFYDHSFNPILLINKENENNIEGL